MDSTQPTDSPPASIFISQTNPRDRFSQNPPAASSAFNNIPSQNIRIEQNWLGIELPDRSFPSASSALGVSIFYRINTIISDHWTANK